MSAAELLPTIQLLPRAEKEQFYRLLERELAQEDARALAIESIVLKPEDQCPYTPEELAQMRSESGGRPLAEIWQGWAAREVQRGLGTFG